VSGATPSDPRGESEVIKSLTEQERQMIECVREWGVKNKHRRRLTIEFREGPWEIVLSSWHPGKRQPKVAVGGGQTFGQAWDAAASGMSDATDEAGNLATRAIPVPLPDKALYVRTPAKPPSTVTETTMTQAELTEIAKAESWEDVQHLGQEYGVDVFAYRLKGQRKDTAKLVGPRARDLGEWCRRLMRLR
jgi:hypothetical protein